MAKNEPEMVEREAVIPPQAPDPTTGVAVYRPQHVALAPLEGIEQKAADFEEALGGETLTMGLFDIVKTPTGGGKFWATPDGMNPVAEIEGVIILRQRIRAYWAEKFGAGGKAPSCSSPDTKVGYGDRGMGKEDGTVHDCGSCPWAQFGTAKNDAGEMTNGQACRVINRIFMLPNGGDSILPTIISLAPTSDAAVRGHFVGRLGARGVKPWTETTKVGLSQEQKGGYTVSTAKFTRGERLSPQDATQVEAYRASIIPHLEALAGRMLEGEMVSDER